jgi:ribosomal protein S27E
METLEDHENRKRKAFQQFNNSPVLNGIECPKCGEELYDSTPNTILASYPPQKNVHCHNCGYVGYRTL